VHVCVCVCVCVYVYVSVCVYVPNFAQASITKANSGIIGMYSVTTSPLCVCVCVCVYVVCKC